MARHVKVKDLPQQKELSDRSRLVVLESTPSGEGYFIKSVDQKTPGWSRNLFFCKRLEIAYGGYLVVSQMDLAGIQHLEFMSETGPLRLDRKPT